MTGTWAISGVDLHLDLAGLHVRAALESGLREAVSSGRLRAGTRLPSSRALAADLGIARNTVAEAYGQLVAEGWLTAVQGSGTRVADRVALVGGEDARAPVREPAARRVRYDLRPGSSDLTAFPRSAWLRAARRALAQAPFSALDYGDPRGRPELRVALANYLARARGVRSSPERIVICSGFTQALWLLCQVLRDGRPTLAVEEYGLPAVGETAAACGLGLRTLPVDDDGAVLDATGDAGALLLTPAHQFPLGVSLAPRRRAEAIEWARAGERLIVEDDYDGEFRYDRHPLGSLQAHAPDHVVYAGTASKTLAPGLRLAWLAVPRALLDAVVAVKTLADRQSGVLDQLTLAELIVSGAYDRHVRRSRLLYRRRRDRLLAALRRGAPDARVSGIAAGLHALVELPPGSAEAEVIAGAAERGLALSGLAAFAEGAGRHRPALVVGYARPPEHAFTAAVARLIAVLSRP
ncbi:MAG: PLP-dependent aminotransferase family protein [Solirubrobacterales bacterium]|nr:PLP-dependent aminotransferase family protein [Solirubrobacterales bacterium]